MLQGNRNVRVVDTTQQHAGSNDCGVFTLLTFAAALKRYAVGDEALAPHGRLQEMSVSGSSEDFGVKGRRFILQSVMKHSVDLEKLPEIVLR